LNEILKILTINLVTWWRNWNDDCFTKIWWLWRLKIWGKHHEL